MADNMNVILASLNEEQKQAVLCTDGPVLIVAGAGSGKTRVLTSRIAYLLANGSDPAGILALTFTKKAAAEMKDRIAAMVGKTKSRRLVMGTFHAIFVRFLRDYAESLGYPPGFTIYDNSDSISAIKTCLKEMQLDDKVYKPKEVLSRISMAKNNLVTWQAYLADASLADADMRSRRPRMGQIYARYQEKLKAAGVMDFDDILLNTNYLLRDNREALLGIADRFTHIMVDEYQDTNKAQYIILKRLAQFRRNICVVGDDSQSIYAFRGAKIENILNFRKDYPECRTFRLECNYRSTKTIVEAANSLIAHNEGRIPKECYSSGETGEKIRIIDSGSEQDEAARITSEILARIRSDHAEYRDFAILYRTNSQSRVLEEQLRRRNVPYMIYSGNSFFERAEVKDMMAYFKLCVNPSDDESFRRVVNRPARGIGATTLEKIGELSAEKGIPMFKAGFEFPKVKPFCEMIASLSALVGISDAHDLARRIADDSGLYAMFKSDTSIEGQSRCANVEELVNSVAEFVEQRREEALDAGSDDSLFTLDDFLENVSLLSNVDVSEDEDGDNKVVLMTVHSAKGLEFPYVFVSGLEENLFPSLSMLSSVRDVEEERRLFYVAVTRAEKAVTLSFAQTRMRNGKHESNAPSRFITEIDSRYFENPLEHAGRSWGVGAENFSSVRFGSNAYGRSSAVSFVRGERSGSDMASVRRAAPVSAAPHRTAPAAVDADFVAVPSSELHEGQRIEHNRFGAGTILQMTGKYPDQKARISFDDYGEKLLLLKYAKLRPLE